VAEQRKNKRFDLELPFELTRKGSQTTSKTGETRNMSSGGVLFTTDVAVDIGDPIEYMITLPTSSNTGALVRLKCVGKVTRFDAEGTASPVRPAHSIAATLERYEFVRK